MKARINNIDYNCVEGSVYTRNYNETLDSMEIRISHLENMLDIEPYDEVLIKGVGSDFYMCVDSWTCIQEGLDPIYYTYEISLFSMVKKLENIILPNIAITPNSENRSIAYYLEQYVREYGDDNWEFSQDGELDRFALITCPEMQWNTPTLREVLNDLMMVDDCICTVIGRNYISCFDLTMKKTPINTANCNYIRRSMSSQDYVSEIRMDLQNAMEDGTTVITERLPFTVSSETTMLMTTNNYVIKTQYPIRNVKHLWINFYHGNFDVSPRGLTKVDLVTYFAKTLVYEYQEYVTLPLLFKPQLAVLQVTENNIYEYQNFCLYFQRYSNVIDGLNTVIDTSLTGSASVLDIILWLVNKLIYDTDQSTGHSSWTVDSCEIEYETVQNMVFSAEKTHKTRNKRVIMDNQTNSFVNVRVQAALEYQKVNRLGNEQLMINQRVSSFNDVITLAQTYEDSIVYQTQYQIYTDHIEVNALATKNYVLQNYFTGIKSHIRTWVNARDEAITRHELIKDTYRLSYTQTDFTHDNYLYLQPLLNDFYEITGDDLTPTKWCGIQTYDVNGDPINSDIYVVDLIVRKLNNSIVFTFGCETNSYVYKFLDASQLDAENDVELNAQPLEVKSTYLSEYGGMPLNFKKYVDTNYENFGIRFILIYDIYRDESYVRGNDTYKVYQIPANLAHSTRTAIINYLNKEFNSPVRLESTLGSKFEKQVSLHKDNREISQYSYQLEFICDEDMIIGSKFIDYQQLVRESQFTLKYYKSNVLSNLLPTNKVEITDMTVDYDDGLAIGVTYTTSQATANNYIYVCDSSDNIIIAFKYKQDTIYLNKE